VLVPRTIDLDSAFSLAARAGRLERLIRSVIADKGLLRGDSLAEVCARVGQKQVPAANSVLVAEAAATLQSWPATTVYQELKNALRSRRPIERCRAWSLAWPLEGKNPVVVHGSCEAIYRDQKGRWRAVIFSARGLDDSTDRLRLAFSALAVEKLGFVPTGPSWFIYPGSDRKMLADIYVDFNSASVSQRLLDWLIQLPPS
jgi:hypothetical protein